MSLNNQSIQGNVSVSRDATIGGHANVRGNSVFYHNVVIKGWLDAKNIKGAFKGLYASVEKLKEAYVKAMPGWYALVGNTLPADIYRAEGGEWVSTGEKGGEVNLYLDDLEEQVSNLDDEIKDIQELIDNGLLVSESISFNPTANSVTMIYKFRESDGTEKQYEVTVPIVTSENAGMMSAADKQTLIELEKSVWPLSVEFTASPSLMEYNGAGQSVELSWRVQRKGSDVKAESVTIKKGDSPVYSGTENPGETTVTINLKGTSTYTLTVIAESMTAYKSIYIQQILPMYFGFAESSEAGSLDISSLVKQPVTTTPSGTYNLTNTTTGHYLWLCVPDGMVIGKVTSSGFEVPMMEAVPGSTTLGGYKCYRSANAIVAGSYQFTLS